MTQGKAKEVKVRVTIASVGKFLPGLRGNEAQGYGVLAKSVQEHGGAMEIVGEPGRDRNDMPIISVLRDRRVPIIAIRIAACEEIWDDDAGWVRPSRDVLKRHGFLPKS
ncbi:MAG: hypothetical protein HY457_02155 [Parcubacteria group bacterium]|nr:hypothetical protein [Parcubacteria group bacterium]